MQTLDNSLTRPEEASGAATALRPRRTPNPNPRFIPAANKREPASAKKIGATRSVTEVLPNIPTTAHILGGAVIGRDANTGVVDHHRAFGYDNLLICDGSAMPANPGVNPSLTITAISEHAMSHIPPREPRPPIPTWTSRTGNT